MYPFLPSSLSFQCCCYRSCASCCPTLLWFVIKKIHSTVTTNCHEHSLNTFSIVVFIHQVIEIYTLLNSGQAILTKVRVPNKLANHGALVYLPISKMHNWLHIFYWRPINQF